MARSVLTWTPAAHVVVAGETRRVPVVSSTPHALWNGVRLAGLNGRVQGFGSVLANG